MSFNTKSSFKRSKPNYLYSIVGVALVLFLIGMFGLILLNGQSIVNAYKEKMNILVEIKPNTPNHERLKIGQHLENSVFTKIGSVKYTSKETAIKDLSDDLGAEFEQLGFSNPLLDVYNFSTKASYSHPDSLLQIKLALKAINGVQDVFYQAGLADNLQKNIANIGWIALTIGILLVFVAITLIHNTIKLALYSNRFLIKNMELVGASWGFISRPFIWKSIKNGFIAGLIAIALLTGIIFFIKNNMIELESLINPQMIGILFGTLLILGILITGLSTYYIVNKYLRMRIDDLY